MPVISLEQLETKKPKRNIIPLDQLQGDPNIQRTEERIAGQPDILARTLETLPEIRKEPFKPGEKISFEKATGREAIKSGLGLLGGAFQRAEAATAAPLLALRKGEGVREAGREFLRGAKGERLVERGDILRSFGVPEPIAATVGFITDPLILKSFFTKSTQGIAAKVIQQTDDIIDKGFSKAIRPSAAGKGTFKQLLRAKNKIREAIRTISGNKQKLRLTDDTGEVVSKLPESLDDLSQAISQTKKTLFDDAIAPALRETGQAGATISGDDIARELAKVSANRTLKVTRPEIASFADDVASRFRGQQFTPQEANDIIQDFNQGLISFYKSPIAVDPNITRRLAVEAGVANQMRGLLDDAVNKTTGVAFKELKNKYGALREIENSVNKALARDANRSIKGLIDYSDVFSGANIVEGIISLNPARIARGVTQKGASLFIKRVNNPNRIIRNMFRDIEKLSIPQRGILEGRVPSILGIGVKERERGLLAQ